MGKKKSAPKKRNEHIYATTKGEVSELLITVNSQTGDIQFGNDVVNVFSEVNYDRPKGPKVLSRIPQKTTDVSFSAEQALTSNFDYLCAVDTNTRMVLGKNLSAVGIVTFVKSTVPAPEGLSTFWKFDVPFVLEYVELKSRPENFGWMGALEELKKRGHIDAERRVGMVVDSDLGNISDYNQRKKPVDGPDFLPANVQLIYASGEVGKDNIVNRALSIADSIATQCLDAVASGEAPLNTKVVQSEWFEGFRIIWPNKQLTDPIIVRR